MTSCSAQGGAEPYTLYRNSNLDPQLRVHWATFDAKESASTYNMDNCLMASGLLNANLDAASRRAGRPRPQNVGFWCEPGTFKTEGQVPLGFPERLPD